MAATTATATATAPATATTAIMNRVPVIDLQSDDRSSIIESIAAACSEYGFFQVVGHGIDAQLVADFRANCKKYFDLDARPSDNNNNNKSQWKRSASNARGFFDDELTKQRRDHKQALDVGVPGSRDWTMADDDIANACLDGYNQFPNDDNETKGFRSTVVRYFQACADLSHAIAVLMAAGVVGCSEAAAATLPVVEELRNRHTSYLRMNYYPPFDAETGDPSTLGVSPHRDAGFLTVLLQDDDCHSLQVEKSNGKWLSVVPVAGAFTINTGDMAQIWSNGRYRSPLHRVLTAKGRRYSAPFFYNPGYASRIEPVLVPPTLAGDDDDDDGNNHNDDDDDDGNTQAEQRRYHACLWGYFRAVRFAGDLTDIGTEIQVEDFECKNRSAHVVKQEAFAELARFDEPFDVERFRDLLSN